MLMEASTTDLKFDIKLLDPSIRTVNKHAA